MFGGNDSEKYQGIRLGREELMTEVVYLTSSDDCEHRRGIRRGRENENYISKICV